MTTNISACIFLIIFISTTADTVRRTDDTNIQHLETLIQQQSAAMQQQSALILQQSTQLQALQSEITTLKTKLDQNTAKLTSFDAFHQKQAAFSVTFQGQHPLNIGDNAAIKFNRIVTNVANGYNPQSGLFTAPYPGVYAFFFSMRSVNNHGYLVVSIYKGNTWLAKATAEGSGDAYDRGSVFVTTHLLKGEQVYARHTEGETYLEAGTLTTFSGVLVSPD